MVRTCKIYPNPNQNLTLIIGFLALRIFRPYGLLCGLSYSMENSHLHNAQMQRMGKDTLSEFSSGLYKSKGRAAALPALVALSTNSISVTIFVVLWFWRVVHDGDRNRFTQAARKILQDAKKFNDPLLNHSLQSSAKTHPQTTSKWAQALKKRTHSLWKFCAMSFNKINVTQRSINVFSLLKGAGRESLFYVTSA